MNQANFEKGRAAELALQKHFRRSGYIVVDLGVTPEDQKWEFPHALHWEGPLILPDLLAMRDGKSLYVECKEKSPTRRGCFSVGVKNLNNARLIAGEGGANYALVIRNTEISSSNENDIAPWIVTFPFNHEWIKPDEIQRCKDSFFIPKLAFRPLREMLKEGPPLSSIAQ